MEQVLDINQYDSIKVRDSGDFKEIKLVLDQFLYVPDYRLKQKIIEELLKNLQMKLADDTYKIKFFIAYERSEPLGFVISQIHPTYTSYGRKCGTFGWLSVNNFEVCKKLMRECEIFIRENKVRKIRGNINFPKGIGGIGIQVSGFEHQMMYGVAFNNPYIDIISYLEKLGYLKESVYTCMKVTKQTWDSGKKIDKNIKLRYLTLKELIQKKEEIFELANNSFQMSFPDASGGEHRLNEMIETYTQVPNPHYELPENFNLKSYSNIPEFIEAWESCNLEKVITWAPMAFDKKTDKLVGIILSLPDLYELWLGQKITRNNVDTAMVRKDYAGKGIFSALNNIGQLTCNLNGIKYYEGTTIWYNNKDAVNSIFPHCEHIRKHYVMQKRIKAKY